MDNFFPFDVKSPKVIHNLSLFACLLESSKQKYFFSAYNAGIANARLRQKARRTIPAPNLTPQTVNPDIIERLLGIVSAHQAKIVPAKRQESVFRAGRHWSVFVDHPYIQILVLLEGGIGLQFIHIAQVLKPILSLVGPAKHEDFPVLQTEGSSESKPEGVFIAAFAAVPGLVVGRVDVDEVRVLGGSGVKSFIVKQPILFEGDQLSPLSGTRHFSLLFALDPLQRVQVESPQLGWVVAFPVDSTVHVPSIVDDCMALSFQDLQLLIVRLCPQPLPFLRIQLERVQEQRAAARFRF